MKYVVVLEINEEMLGGDDSIEVACRTVNSLIGMGWKPFSEDAVMPYVHPLSEMIAC